jgi:ankyrin repeat protein
VNSRDSNGETPLTLAARGAVQSERESDVEAIKLLLRAGADPRLQNSRGEDALAIARRLHRKKIESLLLRGWRGR